MMIKVKLTMENNVYGMKRYKSETTQPTKSARRRFAHFCLCVVMLAALFTLTACDGTWGANSSSWTAAREHREGVYDGGFSVFIGSVGRGHRNRTFYLTADELSSIYVNSTSDEGEIILVISQDGTEDGTEVRLDVSNFDGYDATDTLSYGRIRFSLRFNNISNSETTLRWR
jgi:hypothetical protein